MPRPNLFQSFIFPVLGVVLFLFLCGCKNDKLDIDITNTTIDLEFDRLDLELGKASAENFAKKHISLTNEYGELYQTFIEVMLKEGSIYDAQTIVGMQRFIENQDIQSIFSEIDAQFPKKEFKKNEFENAFRHYKYYFPNDTIPQIIGYYSNFNARALVFGDTLAVGLDMYLGADNDIVKRIPVSSLPQYFKDKMESDYLVSDALKIFLLNKHYKDMGEDFLSTVISLGRIMYLLDAIMPQTEDWKKMGYFSKEIEWCNENEEQIWAYIINDKMLFSVEQERINNLIGEGPNTKGLPANSPSRVGIWMGWQIVKDYMDENPDTTIQELLNEKDSKKILKYYKPQ